MKLKETEKETLNTLMSIYGYNEYKSSFFETNEYKKLRIAMLDNLPILNDQRLIFRFCDKSELLKAGKYIIDKHCNGIDLKIPYTSDDDLKTQLVCRFGENPSEEKYDEMVDYIKNNITLLKVTDLPIYLDTYSERDSSVSTAWFYSNDDVEEKFFKKIPVCISVIKIFGPCDECAKVMYVHEMYHALLDRNKGIANNLLYNEFIPIFMEKVAAYDLDNSGNLLELWNLKRLLSIKMCILDKEYEDFREKNAMDIIEDETYIISGLLATGLFNIYIKGSDKLKREIDLSINEVLVGNKNIEAIIDKYEITLEKCFKIMEQQIKHFS